MTATEFEQIVRTLRPRMLSVALAFFHNEEDAEDAVQEVLLKMWRRKWRDDDDVKALAIKAVRNQCVSMARKQLLRQHLTIDEVTRQTISGMETDQALLAQERQKMIERAICSLTRSEQRIIRMKQQDGLEAEEIAAITGIRLASVRSMLSMARRKLLKQLKT